MGWNHLSLASQILQLQNDYAIFQNDYVIKIGSWKLKLLNLIHFTKLKKTLFVIV